jgi:hypothetical protein
MTPDQVLKKQDEADSSVRELYDIMLDLYSVASKEDILREEEEFRYTFDAMIKQTIECAIFISNYTRGCFLRELSKLSRFLQQHTDVIL